MLGLFQGVSYANVDQVQWYEKVSKNQIIINVELYLSSSCPHCQKAEKFFEQIQKKHKWVRVKKFIINEDKSALKQFANRLDEFHSIYYAVPSVFFCGAKWTGFENSQVSGNPLIQSLQYCHEQIIKEHQLSRHTVQALKDQGEVTQFQAQRPNQSLGFYYVASAAMLDALNQCTLFGFIVFAGFVLLTIPRKNEQFLVGSFCILAISIMKLIQITLTDIYYILNANIRWPSALFALLLFSFLIKNRLKIQNYQNKLSKLLFFSFMTSAFIQLHQQHCLLNVSLIYKQWLQGFEQLRWTAATG